MTAPTLSAELACAARHLNALGQRLNVADDRLQALWRELEHEVALARSDGMARMTIFEWRADLEKSLTKGDTVV